MQAGDGIVIYSPRESYPDGKVLQYFTAIGRIETGEVYRVEMAADFKPYRIDVRFVKCHPTPIKPLINSLSFIRNKKKWGAAFRFGHLEIPAVDFRVIAEAMDA
jgi:predicted RNA-binding protein